MTDDKKHNSVKTPPDSEEAHSRDTPLRLQELRKRAEDKVAAREAQVPGALSQAETQRLLHELQVHQIELEMQNDELRQTLERLEISRARYFDLYDLAPISYFTVGQKGLVLEANLTAAGLFGLARSELVGQPFSRFVAAESQDRYYLHRKSIFESGQPKSCELRMVRTDGHHFWARVDGTLSRSEDGINVCRLTVSDITDIKVAEVDRIKLEQRLQQTHNLESIGVLAGGIAHDFNNLLSGIFGYIDLAMAKTTEAGVSGYLSKSLVAIGRARGLTQQLLTFAKGGAPVREISHLFPFVQEMAQFALSGSNVACNFDVPHDLWPCNFDRNQIGQVIDNLIINAQQSMPSGGIIEVSAKNTAYREKEHPLLSAGNYVRISIKDHGVGIPENVLPNIFNPFFTTKEKGRGLGLAICYSVVARHNGCLEVESASGKGSTFHVYLPAASDRNIGAVSGTAPVTHKGTGRVLVMDDEEHIRDVVTHMLQGFGYSVICREEGRAALEYFIQEKSGNRDFAGIFLDLTIPGGLGGKDIVGEMRAWDKTVPIFVVSGYANDPVMARPSEYGFTASVSKPFRINELASVLNKHMKPA